MAIFFHSFLFIFPYPPPTGGQEGEPEGALFMRRLPPLRLLFRSGGAGVG